MLRIKGLRYYPNTGYSLELSKANTYDEMTIHPDGQVEVMVDGYGGYGGCGSHTVYTELSVNDAKKIVAWLTKNIIKERV